MNWKKYRKGQRLRKIVLLSIITSFFACNLAKNTSLDYSHPGKIIFITGSCSSGKTSMANLIAQKLNAKLLTFDDFAMPIILKRFIAKHYGYLVAKISHGLVMRNFFSSVNKLSEKTKYKFQKMFLADLKNGLANKAVARMYNMAIKNANKGIDVIIESPIFLFDGVHFLDHLNIFKDTNITYVLAYCPWNNLIDRITQRNSSSNTQNRRELDWVFGNYVQYVCPSLNHLNDEPLEKIHGKKIHKTIDKYSSDLYKKSSLHISKETKDAVTRIFPQKSTYYIYPRSFAFNLIINTNINSPREAAERVISYITSNID